MTTGVWGGRRTWLAFALLSFAAVAAGIATLHLSDSYAGPIWLNGMAWIAGAILSLGIMSLGSLRVRLLVLPITVAALATVFLFPDVEGVQRWVALGPLHINVAALLLPMAVVAIAQTGIRNPISVLVIIITLAILMMQPDASQATAFAIAVWIMLMRSSTSAKPKVVSSVLLAAAIALGWTRPDRLQPVPEAELIFELAWQASPLLAFFSVLALAATSLLPMLKASPLPSAGEALALTGYFTTAALCTLVGHYPVPLIGLGMSFVVGYWLGIGLLCRDQPAKSASIGVDAGESVKGEP